MSGSFWTAIVFGVLGISAYVLYRINKQGEKEEIAEAQKIESIYQRNEAIKEVKSGIISPAFKLAAVILLSVTAFFVIISTTWQVPVQNVGIVTEFGAPTGRTTGAGLKFTWPWQKIADFDASLQTENNIGNPGCTNVRIGSLATACVENRIQWRVRPEAAPKLWRDYKGNFDSLKNNFVKNQQQLALNAVFATYNPLSQVNLQTGQVGFDGAKLSEDLKKQLVTYMGTDIEVVTVSVPLVHHDKKTEQNIQQFQDVVAQSRILDQQKANAAKEKEVSDLQRQFLTDEFLKNKCIEQAVKSGYHPGLCLMQSAIVNAPTTKEN